MSPHAEWLFRLTDPHSTVSYSFRLLRRISRRPRRRRHPWDRKATARFPRRRPWHGTIRPRLERSSARPNTARKLTRTSRSGTDFKLTKGTGVRPWPTDTESVKRGIEWLDKMMAGLWVKNDVAKKAIVSNTAELTVVDLGMVTLPNVTPLSLVISPNASSPASSTSVLKHCHPPVSSASVWSLNQIVRHSVGHVTKSIQIPHRYHPRQYGHST